MRSLSVCTLVIAFVIHGACRDEAWSAWLVKSRNTLCREPSGTRRSCHPHIVSSPVLPHAMAEVEERDPHVLPYCVGESCPGPAPGGWHAIVVMS
jgi:hypothetical protein